MKPPSATISEPVAKRAWSEATKRMKAAISSGVALRGMAKSSTGTSVVPSAPPLLSEDDLAERRRRASELTSAYRSEFL